MANHLVNPPNNIPLPIPTVIQELTDAQGFLMQCAVTSLAGVPSVGFSWGRYMKRLNVNLSQPSRPQCIGKSQERLAEVINIMATLERPIDALNWFCQDPSFTNMWVHVCHPSIGNSQGHNDLVLGPDGGSGIVLRGVTDIVSSKANTNKKLSQVISSFNASNGMQCFLAHLVPTRMLYCNCLSGLLAVSLTREWSPTLSFCKHLLAAAHVHHRLVGNEHKVDPYIGLP